jgi:DNA-binding PadR family transcriptional regulator
MAGSDAQVPEDLLPLPTAAFHILVALAGHDRHGYAIMQDIAERTGGKIRMSPGTLYGAIGRLLEQGLISELRDGGRPGNDERRRCYRITAFGRAVATAEARRMSDMLRQARATGLVPKLKVSG